MMTGHDTINPYQHIRSNIKRMGCFPPSSAPTPMTQSPPTKQRERSLHSTTAPCCRELSRAVLHSHHAPSPGCRSLVPTTSPTSPTRKYHTYCFRSPALHVQTSFMITHNVKMQNLTDNHIITSSIPLLNSWRIVTDQITTRSD